MPNGDSTANIEELVEMESQGHPILKVVGEINQFGIGDMRTGGRCGRHPGNPSLLSDNRMRQGDMLNSSLQPV